MKPVIILGELIGWPDFRGKLFGKLLLERRTEIGKVNIYIRPRRLANLIPESLELAFGRDRENGFLLTSPPIASKQDRALEGGAVARPHKIGGPGRPHVDVDDPLLHEFSHGIPKGLIASA
jgi:hypothetical protein